MNTPEILAPAGAPESLTAALQCGADAVYAGGKQFSARHSTENFDQAQLEQAVQLCHLYGAKFYLTLNTMVFNAEFDALEETIRHAVHCGVDAFLVQDLGVLDLIRTIAPHTPIHASTQMMIHTPEGTRWAKSHGISRVVVSRELSRQEIRAICQCGVEVEQFVHGALCMRVSGQCGLSAVIGSRSANRGRCAQACRLPFSASGNASYCALSLKDLCLVPYVQQIAADGVASLKIEGRCKRTEYVAAAVTALVQARNGQEPDLETLRAVFSRSGFTDGYYTGKRQHMFGVHQKEDVLHAKDVLSGLAHSYQKPHGIIPLTMHVTVQSNQPARLSVTDPDGSAVTITGEMPQPAKTRPTDPQQLERQLGKLGGTIYTLDQLTTDCDGVSMLPASALNAMRRDCVTQIDRLRIKRNTPKYTLMAAPPLLEKAVSKPDPPTFRLRLSAWNHNAEALLSDPAAEALLLPVSAAASVPESVRDSIYLTLPRFCADEALLQRALQEARTFGFLHLVCENVAHCKLGADNHFTLHGGMGLNAENSRCLHALRDEGLRDTLLSPELTLAQTKHCTGLPIGLLVYGNQPVMTMRNCPIREEIDCSSCRHILRNRTGRAFPVYCDPMAGVTTMYNAVPTWIADKLDQLDHAAFWLLDLTICTDPINVFRAFQQRAKSQATFTRGLFFRGVEKLQKIRRNSYVHIHTAAAPKRKAALAGDKKQRRL